MQPRNLIERPHLRNIESELELFKGPYGWLHGIDTDGEDRRRVTMDYLRVCGYFTVVDRGSAGEYILAFRQTRAYDIPFWVEEFPARLPNGTATSYCTRRKVRVGQVGSGTNFDIGSVGNHRRAAGPVLEPNAEKRVPYRTLS